ncbi:MAG: hypothetical protein AUJ71_02475 [Candidatus Omnitrophica bacterium CG1_02_49_16]|nr:MAG: hypothetical protein AUJ71_02475 [Candidatus Omnitrophica bacterium CG1_02_49_16]
MIDLETKKLDSDILSVIKADPPQLPERAFENLSFKIFNYQFRRNLGYRQFCLLLDKKPGQLKSWKDIPAIPAAGFKKLALTAFPLKRTVKIFKTSGTTGSASARGSSVVRASADTSLRGAHYFDSLELYEAAIVPPFKKYLMADSEDFTFYFLTSSPQAAPHSSLSHMMGVVNRVFAGGRGIFYIKNDRIQAEFLLRHLNRVKKKVFILSTAFSLGGFLNVLKDRKISFKFPIGSRLMETGGFKGLVKAISQKALYAECEKRLGIGRDYCVSEYGMTELSSQFYDTTLRDKILKIKRRPFKEGPPWMRTLVMDPRTGKESKKGQTGILRHFDLANRGSVLAIQTEDLGRQVGSGFELLGRVTGAELRGCSLDHEGFLAK